MVKEHRILVITPIITESPIPETERDFYQRHASSDFHVDTVRLKFGPSSIDTYYDDSWAAPFVAEKAKIAEKNGYNGILIDCFLDPGLDAAREVVDIPVVGAGEASILIALSLGDSFTILDVGPHKYVKRTPPKLIRKLGVETRFVSIRGIGLTVHELFKTKELVSLLVRECKIAIEEDGADVIVLGCTGMAGLANKLMRLIDFPVIDPALAALYFLETLIRMNLSHSRRTYFRPVKKKYNFPM